MLNPRLALCHLAATISAASLVAQQSSTTFRRIAALPLTAEDNGGYSGAFRVLIEDRDSSGAPFQRLHAPLFTLR